MKAMFYIYALRESGLLAVCETSIRKRSEEKGIAFPSNNKTTSSTKIAIWPKYDTLCNVNAVFKISSGVSYI